jgi:hypothetical protein
MVIRVSEEGTIFENSPQKPRADVLYEFVPEICVASRILTDPVAVDKFREISMKLKEDDMRLRAIPRIDTERWADHQIPKSCKDPVSEIRMRGAPQKTPHNERQPLLSAGQTVEINYVVDRPEIDQPRATWSKPWTVFLCCWRDQ